MDVAKYLRTNATPLTTMSLATMAVQMTAVLASFATALLIQHLAHLPSSVAVIAVVITLTLSRTSREAAPAEIVLRALTLPVVAYAASQVGRLMLSHSAIGDTLFVAALSLAIWLRRFGQRSTRIASLISLPFIGILIVPVPVSPSTANSLWPSAIALMAFVWVTLVTTLARGLGWRGTTPQPAHPTTAGKPERAGKPGIPASSKMALQLGIALGLSFVFGHWLYPHHWPWMVLSCYLVCSGNRGRGDVLHKGVLRLLGAGIGTTTATLLDGTFSPGDATAIVEIFMVLALSIWLRQRSYAFWAAGVTSILSLLNGYYGFTGDHELVQRLGGIFLGALLGVAVSWIVLPVRSGDVFRRRTANSLAALSDYLTALRTEPAAIPACAGAFHHRVAELEQVLPAYRFHHRTVGRLGRGDTHASKVILAIRDVRSSLSVLSQQIPADGPPPALAKTLGGLAKQVGAIRRRMRSQVPAEPAAVSPAAAPAGHISVELAKAMAAVDRLDQAFTVELWRRHGGQVRQTDER